MAGGGSPLLFSPLPSHLRGGAVVSQKHTVNSKVLTLKNQTQVQTLGFRGQRPCSTDPPRTERGIRGQHPLAPHTGTPSAQPPGWPRACSAAPDSPDYSPAHTSQVPAPPMAGRRSVEVPSRFVQCSEYAHSAASGLITLAPGTLCLPWSPAGQGPHLYFPREKHEGPGPKGSRGSWHTILTPTPRSCPGSNRPPRPGLENTGVRTTAVNLSPSNSVVPGHQREHRASPSFSASRGPGAECMTQQQPVQTRQDRHTSPVPEPPPLRPCSHRHPGHKPVSAFF